MDPLSALREYTTRNALDQITQIGEEIRFGGDYSFAAASPTAYKSKQGPLYTLETLVHFVKNHHLKHTDYMAHARRTLSSSSVVVTFIDRKPLLDYLMGRINSSDSIIQVAPEHHRQEVLGLGVDEYRPEDPGLVQIDATHTQFGGNEDGSRDGFPEYSISMIRAAERPLKDRETILECKNRNFLKIMETAIKQEEERQRAEAQQRKDGIVAKNKVGNELSFDTSAPKPKMRKIGDGVPIILVPSASQTLITIFNVKDFLEDGVYVATDVKMKQMKGPKPDCVTVQKKFSRDRVVTAYEVRDKPSTLKAEDWDRVVAVFVLGKEWQFKDWPFKDHVEIFNKVLGFYMRFEDDSVESAKIVKQWNVKIISISKNKRHQDRAAALEVWDRLEEFVRSRSHG